MTPTTNAINPVSPSALLAIAEATFTTHRMLFISGSGGSGKTSIACNLIGPALNREVWLVNLSGQGPQEVIGYGIPQANGDMTFAAPTIWPTAARVGNRPVLLVLDELPDYDPAVRALLRGLYPASGNRFVGPHQLGSDVAIVVTGNRRCDGTRSAVEDAPFTERCVKVTLEPNVGDWLEWYDSEPKLADSGSFVPAFLRFGTTAGDGLDHFNPPVKLPYDGSPHPCPRTWEAVSLAESIRKTAKEVYKTIVRGSVGEATANAYFAFLSHADRLPDIAALKAGAAFTPPTDPAAQYALVNACLSMANVGVKDIPIAVHSGAYDWLVKVLLSCRGDIREFGYHSAVRRGVPLDQHPRSTDLCLG